MNLPKNKNLTNIAQNLRRNMTKEVCHLGYDFLKNYPVQFNRQKVIGNYIVDFYCHKAKLIIELDGSQHFEEVEEENDICKTNFFRRQGLEILRIPNNEIWDNFEGSCEAIDSFVTTRINPHQSAEADSFSQEKP